MLPQSSFDLEGLAAATDLFDGVAVLVSPLETIQRCNDKAESYALLHRLGLPAPAFRRVRGGAEVERRALELGYPDRPVCFKPVFSSGSRGFRILDPTVDRAHAAPPRAARARSRCGSRRRSSSSPGAPDADLLVMELATGPGADDRRDRERRARSCSATRRRARRCAPGSRCTS